MLPWIPTSRPQFALAAVLIATLVAAPPVRAQEGSEAVSFHFAPEDGAVWTYTLEDERVNEYSGQMPRQEQVTTTEVRVTYEKQPDGTWLVRNLPLSASMRVDGIERESPALTLSLGKEIQIALDEEGRATDAKGFRELFRSYERELDPGTFSRLRQSMSAEAMAAGQVQQWNAPLEELRGETVHVGEVWRVEDVKALQGSLMPISGVITFEGWTELSGERGLKIRYFYDSTGEIFAQQGAAATRTLSRRPDGVQVVPSNAKVNGSLLRVISPATGQLLYEVREETTELPVGTADGPTAVFLERHTLRYRPAES